MTEMRELGQRLRRARQLIGYSQRVAAERSGLSRTLISEFERGVREPCLSQLRILADCYKQPIEVFFDHRGPITTPVIWCRPDPSDHPN